MAPKIGASENGQKNGPEYIGNKLYHSRFFVRVGHETRYASSGNRHFFTISDLPKLLKEPTKAGHIFRKQSILKIKNLKQFHEKELVSCA